MSVQSMQRDRREESAGAWFGALTIAAVLPMLAACHRSHHHAPHADPAAAVVRQSVPGPFAPAAVSLRFADGSDAPSAELYRPSRTPGIDPPDFILTPAVKTIFPVEGAWIARANSTAGTESAGFQVSLDVVAALQIEAGGSVLGAGPALLSLASRTGDPVSAFQLKVYRLLLSAGAVDFQQIPVGGSLNPLSSVSGVLELRPADIGVLPTDSVLYLQASDGSVHSPVWTPYFVPYRGIAGLPSLGVDIGTQPIAYRAGQTMDWRFQGVDLGARVEIRRAGLAEAEVVATNSGPTDRLSLAIPAYPDTVLVRATVTTFRSDGTRTWEAFVVVQGQQE